MKILVALCLSVGITSVCLGQYGMRIHAFAQEILPGTVPAMNDGEVLKPKRHYEYQVFIECKRSLDVKLKSIRLNAKSFSARLQEVDSPVVQYHPTTMQNDTLLKRTSHKLLKVVFDKELRGNGRDTTGVSLTCTVRGKHYSLRAKNFTLLAPVAMP